MRRNLIGLVVLLVIMSALYARAGKCAYCYPYACFDSSICGQGCFCAKLGGGLQGLCASLD